MIDATAAARAKALLDDPALAALLTLLNPPGEETRVVGGAIRNALLDTPVHDVDLGTTLPPEAVSQRAGDAGWQAVPTGIEHGTVTLVKDGRAFEVTTLREDIATDGRRALVRFGRDFRADAARRDFTINALSMGRDGVLHDYFDGIGDLARRCVRFIGDPDARLTEDYLRGLRFFRFSAAYGNSALDAAGLAAVLRHRAGFAKLSRERIRQEVLKLLVAEHALPVIEAAEAEGILSEVLGFPLDLDIFSAALGLAEQQGCPLDAIARLAALAVSHAGEDAATWQARLRLSNAEIRVLHRLDQAMRLPEGSPRLMRYRYETEAVPALLLRAAAGIDPAAGLSVRLAEASQPAPEFLISGADIVAAGIGVGPRVGQLLAATEADWIAAGFPAGRQAQLRLLEVELRRG